MHGEGRVKGGNTVKNRLATFPSLAGTSLTKLALAGNNYCKLLLAREVWFVTSRLGTGKPLTIFYSAVRQKITGGGASGGAG